MHPPFGVNFDSRFVSREAAEPRSREAAKNVKNVKNVKNAKKRVYYSLFVPSLEEFSSAMEFRPLRVLRGFA